MKNFNVNAINANAIKKISWINLFILSIYELYDL